MGYGLHEISEEEAQRRYDELEATRAKPNTTLSKEQRLEWLRCSYILEPRLFMERELWIQPDTLVTNRTDLVKLKFRRTQEHCYDDMQTQWKSRGYVKQIVLKARKDGISTFWEGAGVYHAL